MFGGIKFIPDAIFVLNHYICTIFFLKLTATSPQHDASRHSGDTMEAILICLDGLCDLIKQQINLYEFV